MSTRILSVPLIVSMLFFMLLFPLLAAEENLTYTMDDFYFEISFPSDMRVLTKENMNLSDLIVTDEYISLLENGTAAFVAVDKNHTFEIDCYVEKNESAISGAEFFSLRDCKDEDIQRYAKGFF